MAAGVKQVRQSGEAIRIVNEEDGIITILPPDGVSKAWSGSAGGNK